MMKHLKEVHSVKNSLVFPPYESRVCIILNQVVTCAACLVLYSGIFVIELNLPLVNKFLCLSISFFEILRISLYAGTI